MKGKLYIVATPIGNAKNLTTYKDKLICSKCLQKISDLEKLREED